MNLYYEQLFGTIGFDGMSSLLYHTHPPTAVKEILKSIDISPKIAIENNMQMRALKGFEINECKDFLMSRVPVLTNSDVTIHLANPNNINDEYYYKNADADEVIFIHKGEGVLKTQRKHRKINSILIMMMGSGNHILSSRAIANEF